MMGGMGILLATEWTGRRVFLAALVLVPPLYMGLRTPGLWSGEPVQTLASVVSERKAANFQFRLNHERELVDKALRRPWLGWGRWNRMRVYDEGGDTQSVTDGYWVIMIGRYGLIGLVCFVLTMLVPVALFIRRFPGQYWRQPLVAPVVALALVVVLHMVDNLLNAFPNPVFPMIAGALGPLRPALSTDRRRGVSRSAVSSRRKQRADRQPALASVAAEPPSASA